MRNQLGVDFSYDPQEQLYILNDPGPFGYLELSSASLQALQLLSQTFRGEIGDLAEIQLFLDELIARLSSRDRRSLESSTSPVDLDLHQEIDSGPIRAWVWERCPTGCRQPPKAGVQLSFSQPTFQDFLDVSSARRFRSRLQSNLGQPEAVL